MTQANNTRLGNNHKAWFNHHATTEGTPAHWLASAAETQLGQTPTIALKTMRKGGSSSHLRRGWADELCNCAAPAAGADAAQASAAFDILARMMGLSNKTARVGSGAEAKPRAEHNVAQFLACCEFDSSPSAQRIAIAIARLALAGKDGKSTHLGIHSGYGSGNGYRGTHLMLNIDDLMAEDVRAESRVDGHGTSVHIYREIAGVRRDLVSLKRKGGDGPSERYPDQLQATLLSRGAIKAGRSLASTAARKDTGRAIHLTVPAELA